MESLLITISAKQSRQRLDKALAENCELSRSYLQQLIADGHVFLQGGGAASNPTAKVQEGQCYRIDIPEVTALALEPVPMDLDIVYEDAHLLVINKAAGLTVHPAASTQDPTLVHGLLAHCGDSLSGIGGVARPGIVHRLDKDTTGLIIVAKHDRAHQHLSAQLKDRSLSRTYEAICWGAPQPANGTIDAPIGRHPKDRIRMAVVKQGGREARTHYETIEIFFTSRTEQSDDPGSKTPDRLRLPGCDAGKIIASHIRCKLESGRTHQIRVHLNHLGHGLVGDPIYGQPTDKRLAKLGIKDRHPCESGDPIERSDWIPAFAGMTEKLVEFNRQALHAAQIRFIHPETEQEMQFSAPLPADMADLLDSLKSLPKSD